MFYKHVVVISPWWRRPDRSTPREGICATDPREESNCQDLDIVEVVRSCQCLVEEMERTGHGKNEDFV